MEIEQGQTKKVFFLLFKVTGQFLESLGNGMNILSQRTQNMNSIFSVSSCLTSECEISK